MSGQYSYLVIGGSGFLGSYIVQGLVDRGETSVAVYDLSSPGEKDLISGATYFTGDILDEDRLLDVLKETSCTVVFHTVSPVHGLKDSVYSRINEQGTRTILKACHSAGIKNFVFTSSTGVVWSGGDIRGANEDEVQIPKVHFDEYHRTKATAEKMVLDANGENGMSTVVLRPCGMIGPRDKQAMWRLADAYNKGQHNIQMGDNKNLVDCSYVGNIADAHILAADRLVSPSSNLVAGEIFFVTDGAPVPYWNFPRMVWKEMGDDGSKKMIVLSRTVCLILAFFMELWCAIFGGTPTLRKFGAMYATSEQWYNIDKARKLLGYQPRVSLEDASRMMVKWWNDRGAQEHAQLMESRKSK